MKVSYEDLRRWTGKGYQTIKRRLEAAGLESVGYGNGPGKAILWDSKQALIAIYAPLSDGKLDAVQEKAMLDKERRKTQELINREKEGELIDAQEAEKTFFDLGRRIRDHMMSIPNRLSAQIAPVGDKEEVKKMLTKEIRQALTDFINKKE